MAGYNCHMATQTCAFDVIVAYRDRLLRIQVKSTEKPRPVPQRTKQTTAYLWHVKRAGKGGRRHYADNEFDFIAVVALDIRRIAYLPPDYRPNTITITQPGLIGYGGQGKHFDKFPFESAANAVLSA
jgi:hypothetical protein